MRICDTFLRKMCFQKSNLHYTHGITTKRVTCGRAHLRSLAPEHSSEETSQRWRAVGDTVPICRIRDSNPRPSAPTVCGNNITQIMN